MLVVPVAAIRLAGRDLGERLQRPRAPQRSPKRQNRRGQIPAVVLGALDILPRQHQGPERGVRLREVALPVAGIDGADVRAAERGDVLEAEHQRTPVIFRIKPGEATGMRTEGRRAPGRGAATPATEPTVADQPRHRGVADSVLELQDGRRLALSAGVRVPARRHPLLEANGPALCDRLRDKPRWHGLTHMFLIRHLTFSLPQRGGPRKLDDSPPLHPSLASKPLRQRLTSPDAPSLRAQAERIATDAADSPA